jgi:FkbM family methyltransferase
MKSKFQIEAIENKRPVFRRIFEERKYLIFPNDNAVTATLLSNDLYEPYLYQFIVDNNLNIEGTNVVDIGANNGQITIEFANLVGDSGKIYSFEPQRIIFQQLCGNVFVNGLDNVYAYNVALGDEEGLTRIERPDYFSNQRVNFGDVHVGTEKGEDIVEIRKLDSYNFENISIIKIDVQGLEKRVILGAKETINKNRPIIYIEVEEEQLNIYGDTQETLLSVLQELNYSWVRFNDGLPYQTNSGLCLDFVAIPSEIIKARNWKTVFHT